jgi:hypothetical protein
VGQFSVVDQTFQRIHPHPCIIFLPATFQLTSLCSRLRYTNFTSWCDWHLPDSQNVSALGKSKRTHACHSCRQAARICSKFPNKVIAAEISLNCSNGNNNLDPTAEFSVVCDDASDTTLCTVRCFQAPHGAIALISLSQVTNRLCVRSAVDPLCAKHDVFGACFNSVAIDPSSINSGQKLGK